MAVEMKNSGVKWIGKIPVHWGKTKFKAEGSVLSGYPFESEKFTTDVGFPLIRIRDITAGYCSTYFDGKYPSSHIIHDGDFLLGMDGDFNVRWWQGGDALLNQRCCKLMLNEKFYAKYVYYLIPFGLKLINDLAYSTTVKHLSVPDILNLTLLVPPLQEQEAIANFLDEKCAEIDGLLADLEEQIKTLRAYEKSLIAETVTHGLNPNAQMKQSGIPWAEMIPAHWDIQKGKYAMRLLQRPVKDDDGVITCFRDGQVTLRSNRREDGFTMSTKEYGYQGIEPGDLVVHGMDGFAGAIGVSDSRGKATPVLNVLDSQHNKRFLMYYLRNMAYGDVFLALSTGIRVRSCDLSWKKLGELKLILPPIEEQDKIVKFIDDKISRVEDLIGDKFLQTLHLKEYKSSLIYEYVTGKKQVAL